MKKLLIAVCIVSGGTFITNANAGTPTVVTGTLQSTQTGPHSYVVNCKPSQDICQEWYGNGTVDFFVKTSDGYQVTRGVVIKADLPPDDPHAQGTYIQNPTTGEWYHTDQEIQTSY